MEGTVYVAVIAVVVAAISLGIRIRAKRNGGNGGMMARLNSLEISTANQEARLRDAEVTRATIIERLRSFGVAITANSLKLDEVLQELRNRNGR